ncbi:MAG: radical SAM/SPASM domain-containing protein, partial [Rhabdochlamydiaceae bacterium]
MSGESDGPWRITFDTNPDDCNIHCAMCEEHSEYSKFLQERRSLVLLPRRMDIQLVRKVVEEACKHGLREIIPSTMGEPLLYSDFEEILSICTEFNIKMNLTTNGTFPRKSVAEWARLIAPVTSDVKISWNGSKAETAESIMKGIKFEKVLQNVREFIAIRDSISSNGGNHCRVTFQLTFLESNVEELPEIIEIASELGVERVKGHHLWVHFNEMEKQSMRRSPESIRRWNDVVSKALDACEKYRLQSGKKVLLENIFPLDPTSDEISPGGECPFLGKEAWISAEGRFDPCCAPDTLRRTLGYFGSLFDQGLMEIWNGDEYNRLRATYKNNNLCRSC